VEVRGTSPAGVQQT